MKRIINSSLIVLFLIFATSCIKSNNDSKNSTDQKTVREVMTKTVQEATTPNNVLSDLMEGNKRYFNNSLERRDFPAQVKATTSGQYPKAVILSCIDSRVPVELVFDQGVGDLFVVRVAGNIEDEDVLASIEYSMGVAGSKLLMVLGHESCGAVKAAVNKLDVGSKNVTHLLDQIEPAIIKVGGERDSKNKKYLTEVIKTNVEMTIENIRNRSNIVKQLETDGKILIVGAFYNLHDGKVTLLK